MHCILCYNSVRMCSAIYLKWLCWNELYVHLDGLGQERCNSIFLALTHRCMYVNVCMHFVYFCCYIYSPLSLIYVWFCAIIICWYQALWSSLVLLDCICFMTMHAIHVHQCCEGISWVTSMLKSLDVCCGHKCFSLWKLGPAFIKPDQLDSWITDQFKISPVYDFAPTVMRFCDKWEGLSIQHANQFPNSSGKIIESMAFCSWSSITGSSWPSLIGRARWCLYVTVDWVSSVNKHIEDETKWPIFHRWHFKGILLNENIWSSINISLKSLLKGPFNNILSLVQIIAWHRPGYKPLSGPMMVSLLMHIYVTRPQWVKVMAVPFLAPSHSLIEAKWRLYASVI